MAERCRVSITADLPHDARLLELFLQHIRDFDVVHPGCHFSVGAISDFPVAQMEAILRRVTPPFREHRTFRKQ
jgi:hypothetical protein